MFAKQRPSTTQPLKRSDSIASELEMAFLKQPFLEQRLERKHQRTSRKWLRFEATGRTSVVHTDKLQIAEQTGIQLRDLRLLDPQLATSYPSAILARDTALVLNLEFVKAVVTQDCVLILNPEEQNAITFVETLSKRLGGKGSALEAERGGNEAAHGSGAPAVNGHGAAAARDTGIGSTGAAARADGDGNGGAAVGRGAANGHADSGRGGGGSGDSGNGVIELRQEEDQAANSPFELRALEVALDMACRHLAEQTADLEAAAHPALDALTRRVTTTTLERVRRLKTRLVRLKTRVETMKELLEKLLDDDEDMLDLHLSAQAAEADARTAFLQRIPIDAAAAAAAAATGTPEQPASPSGARDEADEEARDRAEAARAAALDYVEQLLEAYFMQVSSTESKLATLYEYVDDTEDYIDIEQDEHRNQLIRMDLLATAAMISLSIITVVTGWYAMNLNNRHPLSYPWFYGVSFISIGLCVVSYLSFLFYCWHKKLMFQ